MLGKHHSEETKLKLSIVSKNWWVNKKLKSAYLEIYDKYNHI
jgi:hypothetical protein